MAVRDPARRGPASARCPARSCRRRAATCRRSRPCPGGRRPRRVARATCRSAPRSRARSATRRAPRTGPTARPSRRTSARATTPGASSASSGGGLVAGRCRDDGRRRRGGERRVGVGLPGDEDDPRRGPAPVDHRVALVVEAQVEAQVVGLPGELRERRLGRVGERDADAEPLAVGQLAAGPSRAARAAANASGPGEKNQRPPAGLPLPMTPETADSPAGATIRRGLSGLPDDERLEPAAAPPAAGGHPGPRRPAPAEQPDLGGPPRPSTSMHAASRSSAAHRTNRHASQRAERTRQVTITTPGAPSAAVTTGSSTAHHSSGPSSVSTAPIAARTAHRPPASSSRSRNGWPMCRWTSDHVVPSSTRRPSCVRVTAAIGEPPINKDPAAEAAAGSCVWCVSGQLPRMLRKQSEQ